ncbi:MAG: POTRA domain-containing protein [Candidatus Poribacteria bacterium]
MRAKIFIITTILLITSSVMSSISWAKIYSEEIEQTISFDNVYDISIDNVDGDIEINAVENLEEISVKVTKRIDALGEEIAKDYSKSLEIEQLREKDRIILKTKAPDSFPEGIFSARVDYHINVPQDIAVVTRSGRGDVTIAGVTGAQDIGAANGTVELRGILGEFQVTVVKGAIKGKIWLDGASAFSTTDGSIDLEILDTLSFPLTLETTNGDINIRLPLKYSADLEARCENGKVISSIPLTIENPPPTPSTHPRPLQGGEGGEKQKSESVLQGKFNDGGPLLKLSASNGDITIQKISSELAESTEAEETTVSSQPFVGEESEVAGEEPKRKLPSAEVVKTQTPPSIDGVLNERVWRSATRLSEFYLANGEISTSEFTEAYLLWDEDNFYVGVKAYDPQMPKIKISQTESDSPVWEDDDIELLIDPNPQTQPLAEGVGERSEQYYHIALNPIGTVFDQQVLRRYEPKHLGASIERILNAGQEETDVTWNSNCIAETEIYPDFWSVEIAIPFKSLGGIPSPSAQWTFNLHRKVHAQKGFEDVGLSTNHNHSDKSVKPFQEYIYWSPTYASDEDAPWPHFPERFGKLRFVIEPTTSAFEPPPEYIRLDKIEISGNEIVSDADILSIIDLKPSERFNPEEIPAIRQTLEESGLFSKVTATLSFSEDSSTLFIEVAENPFVRAVDGSSSRSESGQAIVSFAKSLRIQGNSLFTSQQLKRYFNLPTPGPSYPPLTPPKRGEGSGRIVIDRIDTKCRLIGELYHNCGYPLASIDYRIADGALNITVDEGRIKQIKLVGNKRIKPDEVIKLLDISEGDVYISDTSEEKIYRMAAKLKRENSYFLNLRDWKLDSEQKTLSIDIEEQPLGRIKPHPTIDFNRVNGLMLGGGAQVTTVFAGGGRLYGGASYGISSKSWNSQLGAEKWLFNRHRFTVGGQIHKLTDTNDLGLLSEDEDFLGSALFGEAFEDYFERKGYEARLQQQLTSSTSVKVRYADDEYSSLFINNNWSLFNPSTPKRGNPRIDDGRIRSITVSYEFDTRNVKRFATRNFHTYPVPSGQTQNGWQGYFSMEYAGRVLKGDFDFTLYKFYITRYNRFSARQTFDFRATGALSDALLPDQRLSYLGGVGTLRGYEFKQFVGDNMLLLNLEYRFRLRRSGSSALVAFVDSGYTFQYEEEIDLNNVHTAVGVGLQLGDDIRIDLAQPLEENTGTAFMLRLERMF